MSTLTLAVKDSIPQSKLVPEEMGDKTPPYVPDDFLPLEGLLGNPSSQIVKRNSFFYQSLVRELSENSGLFDSREEANQNDLVSSERPNDKLENMVEEQTLSRLETQTKYVMVRNKLFIQLEAKKHNYSPEESAMEVEEEEYSAEGISTVKVKPNDPTVDEVEVSYNDSSRKRPRTISTGSERTESADSRSRMTTPDSGVIEPAEKRFRTFDTEPNEERSTKKSPATLKVDQVMESETEEINENNLKTSTEQPEEDANITKVSLEESVIEEESNNRTKSAQDVAMKCYFLTNDNDKEDTNQERAMVASADQIFACDKISDEPEVEMTNSRYGNPVEEVHLNQPTEKLQDNSNTTVEGQLDRSADQSQEDSNTTVDDGQLEISIDQLQVDSNTTVDDKQPEISTYKSQEDSNTTVNDVQLEPSTDQPQGNSNTTVDVGQLEISSDQSQEDPNNTVDNGQVESSANLSQKDSNTTMQENEIEEKSEENSQDATPQPGQDSQFVATKLDYRCPICGNFDCPLAPNRQTKILTFSAPKTPNLKRLQSPGRGKYPKPRPQVWKQTSTKTPVRRSILTRSSADGLNRKICNHSPLQIRKSKVQLFKAVEIGDLARVQEIIKDTGAAAKRDKTGCTLLHIAAAHNQVDVVMFLLKLISPNITNKEGQTPAHVAATRSNTQVLKIFMKDTEFDSDKKDNRRNTVRTLLNGHLSDAVMEGNTRQVKRLMDLGANPDSQGGKLANRILVQELGVTTSRQLAQALNNKPITTLLTKRASDAKSSLENPSPTEENAVIKQVRISTRQFNVKSASTYVGGPDVYKMDRDTRGRVFLLNFDSFEKRSLMNLPQLDHHARMLSGVFDSMGYTCRTYSGLTAAQTKEMLKGVRDEEALSDTGCAIFIISGYSVNGKVLTADRKTLDVSSVCSLFKDSECPRLKNKPKLFLFNLHSTKEFYPTPGPETPRGVRLEEPLKDMAVIYSNDIGLGSLCNETGFMRSLCRTLADHGHDMELGDLYRVFLMQYNATSPELRYFGFTKKFYFNPVRKSVSSTKL